MSAVIKSYGYDRNRAMLKIELHSSGTYEYRVSPRVWGEFQKAASKGRYFGEHIRALKHRKIG